MKKIVVLFLVVCFRRNTLGIQAKLGHVIQIIRLVRHK